MVLFFSGYFLKVASVAYFSHVLHLSLQPDREVERKEGLQFARKHSLLFIGMHLWDKNFYVHVQFGIAKHECTIVFQADGLMCFKPKKYGFLLL